MKNTQHTALSILTQIREAGYTAYLAGGSVRDHCLGRTPKDYDIATNALPDQIEELFPKTVAVGKDFGVIVVVQDEQETEVATFREDVGYQDGRRPDSVNFCGAEEDAKRRDFTINGMFFDPVEERVIDYVNGESDLEKKIIRAIGDPNRRFAEDHLRMLRAVRFAHTLGFAIDPDTRDAIQSNASDLAKISIERIENEFSRILTESLRPGDALRELVDLGLMEHIVPEVLNLIGQEQPPQYHPEGDVFEHTVLMLNLMNRGQTGVSAPHTKQNPNVEQTLLPAHAQPNGQTEESAPHSKQNPNVEQTLLSAHAQPNGQTEESAPHSKQDQNVEQTLLSAHPFRPLESSDSLHTSHRRLPHWEQDSRIYFVTFRLADSIAQEKLSEWKEDLDHSDGLTENERTKEYRQRYNEWLDKGHGLCLLKDSEISKIVEDTLLHYDKERYVLGDYVIMPNHVHLIVAPHKEHSLSSVLKSWKGCSARKINQTNGSQGSIWMDESFDHIIRDEHYFEKFTTYIQANPIKSHLSKDTFRLGKGSLHINRQTGVSASRLEHDPNMEQTLLSAHPSAQSVNRALAYSVLLHDIAKPATAFQAEDRIRFHGHDIKGAKMAEKILRRLRIPVKEIKQVSIAIAGHMRFKDVQKMNRSTLRKLMGADTFDLELELHRVDCSGSHCMLDNYHFLVEKSESMKNEPVLPERWVSGKDLRQLGVEPGPQLGELLQTAYDAQLENRFNSKEELLEWMKTKI